jgi:nucleoside phosphorylase
VDRPNTNPQSHYGTVRSGNVVIKDAVTRDWLQEELGVLCVEMEAAGLMDEFRAW